MFSNLKNKIITETGVNPLENSSFHSAQSRARTKLSQKSLSIDEIAKIEEVCFGMTFDGEKY